MSKITNGSMKLIKSEITDIIYSTIGTDLPNNFDKIDAGVDAVNTRVNNIITTPVDGVSAQEIIDARGGNPTLGTRLDNMQTQTDILQEEVDNLVDVGIPKLVSFDYDIQATVEGQNKFLIPYEFLSLNTDTVEVFVNGIAVPDTYYVITEPVEVESVITLGYVTLTESKPVGTIVKVRILKNVPNGDEGSVDGEIITVDSIPLNRIENHDKIMLQDEVTNPSILINGDFRKPINQRNFSRRSYTGSNWAYGIDRWVIGILDSAGQSECVLNDGYISLKSKANDGCINIYQILENPHLYYGKTLTGSFKYRIVKGQPNSFNVSAYNNLVKNGAFFNSNTSENKLIADGEWHVYTFTYTVSGQKLEDNFTSLLIGIGSLDKNVSDEDYSWIKPTVDTQIDIEWVKLELGSKATQFVPRLYGEELALCQRYYFRNRWKTLRTAVITSTELRLCEYNFPVTMRTAPTIRAIIEQPVSQLYTFDLSINIFNPSVTQISPMQIGIRNDAMCDFHFSISGIELKDYSIEIKDYAYEFDAEIY